MLPVGSIAVDDAAACAGFMAAAIAVCGFLFQAPSALAHKGDEAVRAAMVGGGLFGFAIALAIILFGEW
jgi:hypothetical protein